ncbi:MAG TPA: hypothetical protein VFZ34_07125 [Blastocatellia bacterium]|nr:hypothetical protein [Blastocatellia bacterium]
MKKTLFVFATLFTLITTTVSLAQTPTPTPQFSRVQVVKLNPGMNHEWQKFYQAEVLPALKKGGVKQSSVWRVIQGDVRQFVIISPLESWAQLDEPGALGKALGGEAAQALTTKQSRFFAEWHTHILAGRPELSIAPTSTDAPKLGVAAKTIVTPGRAPEWVKGVKENLMPIAQKIGVKGWLTGQVVLGGDPNEFRSLLLFDSYGDIGKFMAAYGKTAAELKLSPAPPAGVVVQSEFLVARYVPELSICPEPQKAAK